MEKEYTFWQELRAAFLNTNVKYLYSTEVERLVTEFNDLSEEDKKEFLEKIKK